MGAQSAQTASESSSCQLPGQKDPLFSKSEVIALPFILSFGPFSVFALSEYFNP